MKRNPTTVNPGVDENKLTYPTDKLAEPVGNKFICLPVVADPAV